MAKFINRLPLGKGSFVPLEVIEVPKEEWASCCGEWDRTVGKALRQIPGRADSQWNWTRIARLYLGAGLFRKPRLLQLRVGQRRLPAAMVALLEAERWFDGGGQATFVWYLSTAPTDLLEMEVNGVMAVPKLVGRAALDAAMVVSASCGADGKLWLHADPKGVDLIGWYSSIPGLTRVSERQFSELPGSSIPIRIAQRKNDGRYFASHASTSLWTLGDMDHLRS